MFHEPCQQGNSSRKQDPAVDYFYSAAEHRSRGALCPSFAPARIGAELLFEMLSQRYERGSTLITSNLPFQEWTEVLGSERLTGALLDRLTHHVHILEMNGDSYRLKQSRRKRTSSSER